MVIFYTMAYNAEKTLPHTIQSVLDQTEPDWIWYLLDNGSQDTTGAVIGEYAAKDSRIIPLRNEKNLVFTPETSSWDLPRRHNDADWLCFLDADDAYTPDFLRETLDFSSKYHLDVVACGFDFVEASTGEITGQRILPQDMILTTPEDFDTYFPVYHQFMRTNWAKLFSIRVTKRLDIERIPTLFYGWDTLYTQEALRNSTRFGILAKSLHKYYVFPKSRSYQWTPSRFQADQTLHNLACSYLIDKCGRISPRNRWFLQEVYSNAVTDTINVLQNAAISPSEKLKEYSVIATNPTTLAAYRECADKDAARSKMSLLIGGLEAGKDLGKQDDADLRTTMQALLPRCGQAVNKWNARLFLEDPALLRLLLQDDADTMMEVLLERIETGWQVKKYALAETVRALAVENALLCQIGDAVFLRRYAGVYRKVWKGDYPAALEEMTGLLMEKNVSSGRETFLTLFVSLAALENQAAAFIFGKIQLAEFYLRQGNREQCRAMVADLTEMGVEDEELEALRRGLQEL